MDEKIDQLGSFGQGYHSNIRTDSFTTPLRVQLAQAHDEFLEGSIQNWSLQKERTQRTQQICLFNLVDFA